MRGKNVDITNFILHESGQPLHAFDESEITGKKIIVKNLPAGTIFKTLDEKERVLTVDDLMICNEEDGMCIAGIFGGVKSVWIPKAFFKANKFKIKLKN